MSNRYLFRGKRVDSTMNNGKFVEGFVVKGDNTTWIFTGNVDYGGLYPSWDKYVVDPETVGMWTGLLDKNGKKVFEGDQFGYGGEIRFVQYIEDRSRYVLTNGKGYDSRNCIDLDCDVIYNSMIIGSIHD